MYILSNYKVLLKSLTIKDADFFYKIYARPELQENFDESPFLPGETATEFTSRIISLCEFIWTIRPANNPKVVIGDCALHHWNQDTKEIVIGGSLLPEYWGKGLMQSAFDLIIPLAKEKLGVEVLLGPTKTRNYKAIRLVEKMGFIKTFVDENDTIMRKEIG